MKESEGTRSDFIWASWFCLLYDLPLGHGIRQSKRQAKDLRYSDFDR